MARKTARPGRTLVAFFMGLAILYGLVAIGGNWTPQLGLDLRGGTRITLDALGDPDGDSLEEARQIIDDRVNGSGVSEAEVTTQSGQYVVVEIPGQNRRDLVDVVSRQAQLRFRLVACWEGDPGPCATGAAVGGNNPLVIPETADPSGGATGGGGGAGESDDKQGRRGDREKRSQGNNRPPVGFGQTDQTTQPSGTASPTDGATPSQGGSESPEPQDSTTATPQVPDYQGPKAGQVKQLLAWQDNPDAAAIQAYNNFTCPPDNAPVVLDDDPNLPIVSCEEGVKYLLSPAVVEGTDLEDASYGTPQQGTGWVVQLKIGGKGEDAFEEVSRALLPTNKQFAIVLDGQVVTSLGFEGVIPNGEAQITGDFTETEADELATSLRYGALPIAFDPDITSQDIGASLAGNQLEAGLLAGAIGFALVLLFCLFYYRGLGIVVVASLFVAAVATYGMVLLLSKTAGFTLTLPGIAGFIIAVGATADSFIIFFERIRDEMREGRSMRVAVETGWRRAKKTRLAANVVSLLSALVLYIFATGVVKGFGFALGLSTLIDLAILFWFTKPMVSFLARFKFFNGGGELSGLSAGTLGIDRVAPSGGKA